MLNTISSRFGSQKKLNTAYRAYSNKIIVFIIKVFIVS